MTDSDIVKALECCCKNNNCDGCPLDYLTFSSQCASELAIKSLDIINRQKAEIERLNKEVETFADIGKMYSEIKAEAYREFAERVKICLQGDIRYDNKILFECDIDNILKELVGEDE